MDVANELVASGKIVIIAALDGTYERKPFGTVLNLIPMAEKVDKLTAVCAYCSGDAAFTMRLTHERGVQVIGGKDKYASVCRGCYKVHAQV